MTDIYSFSNIVETLRYAGWANFARDGEREARRAGKRELANKFADSAGIAERYIGQRLLIAATGYGAGMTESLWDELDAVKPVAKRKTKQTRKGKTATKVY